MIRGGSGRANRHRGEVEAVFDGERRILCLTLGALAELETAFAADGLGSGGLKARDLIAIIGAGLRGGGNAIDDEEVAAMGMEGGVAAYASLVGELLTVTFTGGEASKEADPS